MQEKTFESLFEQVRQLSTEQRLRMVELLAETLRRDLQQNSAWHEAVRETYGILADDPIERPSQLPLTERDPLE
jgi:hypothetical protein